MDTWHQIKDNWLLVGGALGVFAALQFTPAGPILDAVILLAAGFQAGYSLAAFVVEAGWAETQQDLYEGAQHFTNFLAALLDIATTPIALLRQSTFGISPINGFDNFWAAFKTITNNLDNLRQPGLTTAQRLELGISALFKTFNAPESAIGRLLGYGETQVIDYLKRSVDLLPQGFDNLNEVNPDRVLPWIDDLGDRWQNVNDVAERLDQNSNVATFLSENANLVEKVLEEGGRAVDSLSDILSRPETVVNDLATLLQTTDISSSEVQTLLRSIDNASVNIDNVATVTQLNNLRKQPDDTIDLLRQELNGGHSIARHGSQVTAEDLRLRMIGQHPSPNIPQSRAALSFQNDFVHRDSVNQAFQRYESEIRSYFDAGEDYGEWVFDYGQPTGSGFHNFGSTRNPNAQEVSLGESTKVIISVAADISSPSGFRLVSAYPLSPHVDAYSLTGLVK